ncbi:MAG: hypothetical protein ABEJ27_05345 [Halodesulfurarchaeum sp.]
MSQDDDGTADFVMLGRELCDRRQQFFFVFAVSAFFLLLMVPYLLVAERDSALFVVVVLNVIGLSLLAAFSGSILLYCRKHF